jgi:hypothetical protein
MNCIEAERLLSRHMDGELDAEQAAGLQNHLEACPQCAETRDAWAGYSGLMHSVAQSVHSDTDALWADVAGKLGDQVSAPVKTVVPWPFNAKALTALAAVVILSVSVYMGRSSISPDEATFAQASAVEYFETDLPGASPMLYIDAEVGWTVVWVVEADASSQAVFQQPI